MTATLRRDLITISILWVILSVLGEAGVAYMVRDFPGMASSQGVVTSDAFLFLLRITVPVFLLVVLIIGFCAIRFRVADSDAVASAKQYHTARTFPVGWLAMSVILNVLFIFHPGISGLESLWSMAAAATNPLNVEVTAKQWEWSFDYPAQKLSDVAELVVPVNTPIRFQLNSEDVIHSFWVPAWGIKKAVIPGETRTLVVTPDRISSSVNDPMERIQCSQICGAGHAEMRGVVRVVSREDFDKWVAETHMAQMNNTNMNGMQMKMQNGNTMPQNGGNATPQMNQNGMQMNMQNGNNMPMNMPQNGNNANRQMNQNGMQMNMQNGNNMPMNMPQNGNNANQQMNHNGTQMNMQNGTQMNMNGQKQPQGNN